ncbi:hypothetical protein [Hyalangium gracile]|uniref:hypothetical protein n=1 Tax=Hyalangium gracile TaxID=394092 RepID=UPI001CCDDA54|nr:hypothetical protein [Hyalangium gracile]
MKLQELRDVLSVSQGDVVLSRDRLGPAMGTFLDTYFEGQNVTISSPSLEQTSDDEQAVTLKGRSSVLGVADLPVTARFSLDTDGNVRTRLTYTLRDTMPGPGAWTFSRSFPKLPTVWNYDTGYPINDSGTDFTSLQKPFVESLDLFDTQVIVSSHAETDEKRGVALEPGHNVVSQMRSQGMVGVLEYAMTGGGALPLRGTIRIPKPGEETLSGNKFVATRALLRKDVPGIHLRAPLPLDFKIGKLSFEDPTFLVYTPTSTDWMATNGDFSPTHGYSARLSVPSAGITLDLSADLEWNLPRVCLYASCEGMKLGKLASLVDLCGTDSLASLLPDELRSAVEKLEALELMGVTLILSSYGRTADIDTVSFTVGMPSVSWKIWGDDLVVNDLSCRFDVDNPFGSGKSRVGVTVSGTLEIEGVPISVSARSRNGFTVFAHVDNQSIPIERLFKKLAPGAAAPSDISVGTLSMVVSPGKLYSAQMLAATSSKPFVIPVGRSNLTVSNVLVDFSYPKGGPVSGKLAGTAAFGKSLQLSVSYGIPGDITVRGTFQNIQLTSVIGELCDLVGEMPPGFDLTLSSAAILVQKRGNDYVFNLGTTIDGFGALAFEARKVGTKWGFAAGLDLATSGISKIPGLSALEAIEDVVKLEKLMLVVSSFDNPSFQFPSLAQFNTPQLATKSLAMPATAQGVTQGFMVFADWQLDANDKQHSLLMKLLGLGSRQSVALAVSSPNPSASSRLFFKQRTKIQGLPFDYQLGILLQNGKPSMFLTGNMQVEIQGQKQTFDTTMAFVPSGAFLSATMKGSAPVDCKAFKLSNLALQIGVNWGGIPSLGIACTIDTSRFSSSVAIFFDSTNPSNSLVAGSLSQLTLNDVTDTLLGSAIPSNIDDVLKTIALKGTHRFKIPGDLTDELDGQELTKLSPAFAAAKVQIPSASEQLTLRTNKKGESWHLTDLTKMRHYALKKSGNDIEVSVEPQFYFAPQKTSIGSIAFPQGYYLNAAISFAGFDASATVDIAQNRGISVEAQMDKIVILDEKVFSIAALQGGGGPKLSVSTFTQNDNPVPQFRPPHFYVNGSMTMLGVKQGIYASVSVQGIDFELVGNLAPGVKFDLDARFGKSGFGANGTVKVGVGTVDLGALGKAKINTDLEVEVDVDIDNAPADISLAPGSSYPGESTLLSNGFMRLVFQADGNLVLYKSSGEVLWASATHGRDGTQVAFQGDGNLVIYNGQSGAIWASNTNGQNIARLTMQGDGNVVMYDKSGRARWSTGTAGKGAQSAIELESSFDFAGQHVDLGRFKVDVKSDTFTRLPDIMSKKVEEALREVFKDMNKWADAVKDGVMDGVNDTAKVFKDVYGKSEKEAKDLANSVNKGVNQATKAVENTAKDVSKSVSKTAKKAVKKMKFW